ncbi:hypothetical protein Landi51_11033 [Colletotrichum acutatum]
MVKDEKQRNPDQPQPPRLRQAVDEEPTASFSRYLALEDAVARSSELQVRAVSIKPCSEHYFGRIRRNGVSSWGSSFISLHADDPAMSRTSPYLTNPSRRLPNEATASSTEYGVSVSLSARRISKGYLRTSPAPPAKEDWGSGGGQRRRVRTMSIFVCLQTSSIAKTSPVFLALESEPPLISSYGPKARPFRLFDDASWIKSDNQSAGDEDDADT